jgi:hypothetical protein
MTDRRAERERRKKRKARLDAERRLEELREAWRRRCMEGERQGERKERHSSRDRRGLSG